MERDTRTAGLHRDEIGADDTSEGHRDGTRTLELLVGQHRTFLRFLERRVHDRDTAEDLLQEAFGRAVEAVEAIRADESAVAWFYRVLRNAVVDHYRRRAASSRALEAFARELDEAVPPPEVEAVICECIGRLARTLKPDYADAIARVDLRGMPVKTYAEETGISPANAGVRVFRARQALRKQVMASCGTCAEHGCVDCTCGSSRRRSQEPPTLGGGG
jgi:RNA polymerase sigma factor (sigma-70 family)